MSRKSILEALLLLAYEIAVLLALIGVVRWLTVYQQAPIYRAAAFLVGMALFVPPLMFAVYRPYIVPVWLAGVQAQGKAAPAEVVENKVIGSYWRPQDMGRYVEIKIKVKPADQPAFQTRLICRLDQAQNLAQGAALTVRYDPQAVERAALPLE